MGLKTPPLVFAFAGIGIFSFIMALILELRNELVIEILKFIIIGIGFIIFAELIDIHNTIKKGGKNKQWRTNK